MAKGEKKKIYEHSFMSPSLTDAGDEAGNFLTSTFSYREISHANLKGFFFLDLRFYCYCFHISMEDIHCMQSITSTNETHRKNSTSFQWEMGNQFYTAQLNYRDALQ